ncbi:MAG TPA: SH3 domain-containing protein [bacterium]|nr:SH3 domain-containing protein [bacterium]
MADSKIAGAAPHHTRATLVAISLLLLLASCSTKDRWALVLWPPEGSALAYGAVVPIQFKSNITKTYAVDVPKSRAKEELDLWRVQTFSSRSKAKTMAASFAPLASIFGVAARDGLLLREKPDNTSDQVYRLRLGQEVKLLGKVDGAALETGGARLEGDWYEALSDDGTRGYVFSNQLLMWDASKGPKPEPSMGKPAVDSSLSSLFDTTWRPDYFDAMVAARQIDLGSYQPRFGLFADALRKVIRVERSNFSRIYKYTDITKHDDGTYEIVPGGATFYFTSEGSLIFVPSQADIPPEVLAKARSDGGADAVVSYAFVRQQEDVLAVVAAEERRQLSLLASFVAAGERFESESTGVFIATKSTRFTWVAYGSLTPRVIPEGAGETGSIAMDLFLSPELAGAWDGAFTLRFDGDKHPVVRFAYKLDGDTLTLAYVPPESVQNAVISVSTGLETVATLTRYR